MYTVQQILNNARVDENGDPIQIMETMQQAFNAIFDPAKNALRLSVLNPALLSAYSPAHYERDQKWQIKGNAIATDRYTLLSPNKLTVNIDNTGYELSSQIELDLSLAASWDNVLPTDYTVAANRAGKDFYIYACKPASGVIPVILCSPNSTWPDGYDADNSRQIAGFHCLCLGTSTAETGVTVALASDHPAKDFATGDLIPPSVWDLLHCPACSPEGMVFCDAVNAWEDIYLMSGTGTNAGSFYGAAITDTRDWMDFADDLAAIGKELLHDSEFQAMASGSNEETNIAGGADPVTTGGHVDTAGRRMISNYFIEDCCGVMWQWLQDQSYRYDGGGHTHTQIITHKASATGSQLHKDQAETKPNAILGSGADETIIGGSTDPAPAWGYYNLPGSKGSSYKQGSYGDVKLLAGAPWARGAYSGSRARYSARARWDTASSYGGRGRSPKK